jgi:hypothetical protein
MKIKMMGQLGGLSLKKDQVYSLVLIAPLSDIAGALSTVRLINQPFLLGISTGDKKVIISEVVFGGLNIHKDGQSKITFLFDSHSIKREEVGNIAEMQDISLKIVIKADDKDSSDEENN